MPYAAPGVTHALPVTTDAALRTTEHKTAEEAGVAQGGAQRTEKERSTGEENDHDHLYPLSLVAPAASTTRVALAIPYAAPGGTHAAPATTNAAPRTAEERKAVEEVDAAHGTAQRIEEERLACEEKH